MPGRGTAATSHTAVLRPALSHSAVGRYQLQTAVVDDGTPISYVVKLIDRGLVNAGCT